MGRQQGGESVKKAMDKCMKLMNQKSEFEVNKKGIRYATNKDSHMIILLIFLLLIVGAVGYFLIRSFV